MVTGTAGFIRRYQIDRPLDFLRPHDLQVKAIWVVAAVIPKGYPIAAVVNRDIKHPYHHKWSLRSIQGGPNCNEIAKRFGGGGHPNAAGFSTATLP